MFEEFANFLASETGQTVSLALIGFSFLELIMVYVPFMPLCKHRLDMERKVQETFHLEEKKGLEQRLKNLNMIKFIQTGFGIGVLIIGIYGLTL
ncbi:MAG: hypothetical protein AB7L92_01255 [Alphaproteobacteria bacterium]